VAQLYRGSRSVGGGCVFPHIDLLAAVDAEKLRAYLLSTTPDAKVKLPILSADQRALWQRTAASINVQDLHLNSVYACDDGTQAEVRFSARLLVSECGVFWCQVCSAPVAQPKGTSDSYILLAVVAFGSLLIFLAIRGVNQVGAIVIAVVIFFCWRGGSRKISFLKVQG
jgi:hypothetical protein